MHFTSIRRRISFWVGLCLLITAMIIVIYSALVMKRNATTARQRAIDIATKYTVAQAKQHANHIRAELEVALDTALALAHTLAAIKDDEFDIEIGRDEVSGILKSVLEKNPQFVGVYTGWEPDAFDQMDIAFARTEGHDATGRFIPHWSRTESGQFVLEPLLDYEKEGKGDYYLLPKHTKHECITDPYLYPVQENELLITSLTAPIIVDETFYGIVGINLQLDLFQNLVNDVQDFYEGTATILLISHNGILAAVTGNSDLIGKPITHIYDDVQTDLDNIQNGREIVEIAEDRLKIFTPLKVGRTTTPWSVNILVPIENITADADKQLRQANYEILKMIGISVLCIIGAFGLLGFAARSITNPIIHTVGFAERLSAGDLSAEIKIEQKDELGAMAAALRKMKEKIYEMITEVEQQNWLKTGQAELSDTMRGEQDLPTLGQHVILYLANYVQAQIGTMYLADEEKVLHLVGSYAYATRKGNRNEFKLGEGLVGQAALEKRGILFTNVPDDYIAITSGLGETFPRHIFVTPFLYEGEVKGVIELGTVTEFTELQRMFLDQAVENIAIAFHSAQVREKMQELLEATQQQAEELQAQQEQLRVNNEELEAQADALRQSEQRLQAQQEELRQTNEELAERSQALEQQQKILQEKNLDLENARKLVEDKAKELEVSSKYKSEFLANMSHELRTPLNSLLILSKLLSENKDGNLTEKQIEFAQTIHAGGSELLELINEVLDLSKVEAGKMAVNIEKMSLKGFTSYIEQNFTHVAEKKGLALKVNLADGLPPSISTDRQRVEQIVKNLLSNAIKFTQKGEIRVTIERPAVGMIFSSSGFVPQQSIAIAVSDTGIGIPEAKRILIFEAFRQADGTTSRKYGGTGLGLSIVREFTRLLGGEIQVESKEGKGSTFTLYLPEVLRPEEKDGPREIQGEASTIKAEDQKVHPSAVTSTRETVWDDRHETISLTDKTLLIIEDDPKFAKILFDLARERGFKGLVADDGAAGLQLAYQYTPSAVILDIALPGMDGWTVMEKLKQNPETRHIPVHFISASDQSLEAWKMGAIGYLTKPVTIDQVNEAFTTIEEAVSKTIKKLLIVEDDEATRFSMTELLRGDDVDITTAQTGEEAYTLLESEKFDCMVLDLGLEDISGMDLVEKIREEARISHLPIIIYTGKELTKEEDLQLERYAESIIIKGVKSQERLLDEVTLFLHRVEADLPEAQQKKLRILHDKEAVLSGKIVLIVDDDMRNVFALSNVLEEKGMHVLVGEHGKEALEFLDQHPEIDIVLMDIMMPEMDGYEAMGHIRKQPAFKNLPIIALTAKAMKGDRQRSIDAGASDYLSKPVDTDKLLSLLRVWLY